MPTAFSAEEKARVEQVLLESGRDLFTQHGLRKTSLDELVAPAGIAKSSFYLFFDSKEALYLELMLREAGDVKRKVIDQALRTTDDTAEALRRFLRATLDELATNPLWRRLTTHPDEMQAVARKLDPARLKAVRDNPATALTEFVIDRSRRGDLVAADPAVIVGVLQTVLLVPLHADRLGDQAHYPRIVDLLVDLVATGLVTRRTDRP